MRIFLSSFLAMSLTALFSDFAVHLQSPEFHKEARHPEHPRAFSRRRKLPLPALVAVLLSGLRKSVQTELDEFFAHLQQQAQLARKVTEQAFAQARVKLATTAIPSLNDWLIARAESDGYLSRWHGLRLVAADASPLRLGLRASHQPRAAHADQILFGLCLPGADLMLAATLHSPGESERHMLFEQLHRLSNRDLLLLDRGYPCRWLAALLTQRQIPFCMRVEQQAGGFACVRAFLRSGLAEQIVTLPPADAADVRDYGCPATPVQVRLVRHVASTGAVRVLMTNLLDSTQFPAELFGDLYHYRWRIEETFKRLKHRLNFEHVSGLSQLAVMQDVAAKVLCDNLQTLIALEAYQQHAVPPTRRINHAAAISILKPLMPSLLLGRSIASLLSDAMALLAKRTYSHRPGRSNSRQRRPKPHKFMTNKPC
jgi:hypothetical protein